MNAPNSLVGQTLGQYQILEVLGQGGMATVYKGWQSSLQRNVAIKVLLSHLSGKDFIKRFRQEAVVAAKLNHPNIVTIYEVAQQDGHFFIVMEYVEGHSLSDILLQESPLPLPRVVHLLRQLAGALDYAHRHHFVHRDIKPSNILVTADDRVVITDFGIVKALEGSGATAQLTVAGSTMGTPAYMAPEQIQGLPVDYRVDLYSLGIVCYEMLGGRPPFGGTTTAAVLYAQVHSPPPSIRQVNPAVPKSVEKVLKRMLSKDPDDRFPDAEAFVNSLADAEPEAIPTWRSTERDRWLPPDVETDVSARPSPTPTQRQRSRKISPLVWILGVAALLLVVALGATVIVLLSDGTPPAASTPDATNVTVVVVLPESTPVPGEPTDAPLDPTATLMAPTDAPPAPTDIPTEPTEDDTLGLPGDLAFHSDRDGDFEIYVLEARTGQIRQLTDNTAIDIRPDWSPDGSQIAFQSERDGNKEIYVMNSDGSGQRRLTDNDTRDMKPVWSPDGRQLLFESDRDGNPEIYLMDSDGNNLQRLTTNTASDWAPAWSPDGQRIAFMSNRDTEDKTYELYIMDLAGQSIQRLTDNSFEDFEPAWSPNGNWIAFASNRADTNWDIYLISPDGETLGLQRLTNSPAADRNPAWSPDGSKIAFESDREGHVEILIMNPDGSDQERPARDPAEEGHPRWAPLR